MYISIAIATAIFLVVVFYFYIKNEPKLKEPETTQIRLEPKNTPEPKAIIYNLQTHELKYWIYNARELDHYNSMSLYRLTVTNNLWMNEPYHSTVFSIIKKLDEDILFCKSNNTEVKVANIRNNANKIVKVINYKVVSVLEILFYIFNQNIKIISSFRQKDAQKLTLAIFVFVVSKSKHFESFNAIDVSRILLKDYGKTKGVNTIVEMIERKENKLLFVEKSFLIALENMQSQPYADYGQELKFVISQKLPEKNLITI